MSALPAAAEPRHPRGGAGGAARGQWVRYPLRLVLDAGAYADADTKVYGKVRALARGRECEASLERLAEYTGLAVSTVEKALGRLSRPAPTDGVTELTRRQRSHPGTGTGRTTARSYRALESGERYVSAPVLAADTLRGTLHRLYLLLRYTQLVERRQLTLAEMGWVLRHRTGKLAGQGLAEAVVTKLLMELAAAGWITLDKRAGYRGRHLITVHDDPVRLADEPGPTPDPEGGAAPDLESGALAYREDHESLNDPGKITKAGGGIRRRRPTATSARELDAFGRRTGLDLDPGRWRTVWQALGPVRSELGSLTGWEWQRLVTGIVSQLDQGATAERLADRIGRRYATMRTTDPDDDAGRMRSLPRWLIGAALVRRGCADPRCESGVIWGADPDDHEAGRDCRTCLYTREAADTRARLDAELAARERQAATRAGRRTAGPGHTAPQQPPGAASPPPTAPPNAPERPVGPPPVPGGWRALVARERPDDAARTYRDRWKGDHARHLPPTGT